jgi:lipoate-protein ligase A
VSICFLDLTLPTPEENLALDEALLLAAEQAESSEVLRFWELTDYAVVLGSSGRLAEEVIESACQADGVPILRRASGGGTVLLGPGCLCFSLVLAYDSAPPLRDVTRSYTYILERIAAALQTLVPGVVRADKSDLALGDRKFSGNSQRRMRTHLLHHGTILYDFDTSRIERYLHSPKRQPEYRRGRSHQSFVGNLPLDAATIKRRIRDAWQADQELSTLPMDLVRRLVEEK